MIFIICIVLGVLGIFGTMWIASADVRSIEYTIPHGKEWFSLAPETDDSAVKNIIRTKIRAVLKVVLIWLIAVYRDLSKKITVKQAVKQKVREFLYEHDRTSVHIPSDFITKVKSVAPKKRLPRKKKTEMAPTEVSFADTTQIQEDHTFEVNPLEINE